MIPAAASSLSAPSLLPASSSAKPALNRNGIATLIIALFIAGSSVAVLLAIATVDKPLMDPTLKPTTEQPMADQPNNGLPCHALSELGFWTNGNNVGTQFVSTSRRCPIERLIDPITNHCKPNNYDLTMQDTYDPLRFMKNKTILLFSDSVDRNMLEFACAPEFCQTDDHFKVQHTVEKPIYTTNPSSKEWHGLHMCLFPFNQMEWIHVFQFGVMYMTEWGPMPSPLTIIEGGLQPWLKRYSIRPYPNHIMFQSCLWDIAHGGYADRPFPERMQVHALRLQTQMMWPLTELFYKLHYGIEQTESLSEESYMCSSRPRRGSAWALYSSAALNVTANVECDVEKIWARDVIESELDLLDNARAFRRIFTTPPAGISNHPPFVPPLLIPRTCPSAKSTKGTIYSREISSNIRRIANSYSLPVLDTEVMMGDHLEYLSDNHHFPAEITHEIFNVLLNIIKQSQ